MTDPAPVVVATDLTARSDRPFDRALRIARERECRLVVAHVVEEGRRAEMARHAERARRTIGRLVADMDARIDIRVEAGSPPEVLGRIAGETEAAMVVVGAARYNHLGDFFLGTAVDYLVRHAAMPVLVVKNRPLSAYDRIIATTDFSDRSRHALLTAAGLFPRIPISLVNAFQRPFPHRLDPEDSYELAKDMAQEGMTTLLGGPELVGLDHRIVAQVTKGPLADVVADMAEQADEPLVVIGSHGFGKLAQVMLDSRASELLQSLAQDTLVVR